MIFFGFRQGFCPLLRLVFDLGLDMKEFDIRNPAIAKNLINALKDKVFSIHQYGTIGARGRDTERRLRLVLGVFGFDVMDFRRLGAFGIFLTYDLWPAGDNPPERDIFTLEHFPHNLGHGCR